MVMYVLEINFRYYRRTNGGYVFNFVFEGREEAGPRGLDCLFVRGDERGFDLCESWRERCRWSAGERCKD